MSVDPRVIRFLDDRDLACPRCSFNLRGLRSDRCPECGFGFDYPSLIKFDREFCLEWYERPWANSARAWIPAVATLAVLFVGRIIADEPRWLWIGSLLGTSRTWLQFALILLVALLAAVAAWIHRQPDLAIDLDRVGASATVALWGLLAVNAIGTATALMLR